MWILRTKDDLNNPTLAGGVYGRYITAGRPVYYYFDGTQTRGIILIADGGKYGLDSVESFEYKGDILEETTNWIFHRGTLPLQITPKDISSINTGTDVVTCNSHGFSNGHKVRFGVSNGNLSPQLSRDLRYTISDATTNTFKVKNEAGSSYIDFVDGGSGTQKVWRANAGFDDPDQGLPTFCPETGTTFSNIAYVEFKLPTNRSTAGEEPDWQDFRIIGTGRRLMDYNSSGTELGVVSADADLLANVALEIADNLLNSQKIASSRIDWASWHELRTAAHTQIWQRVLVTEVPDPAEASGFTGRYYQNQDFTDLKVTRLDSTINMGGDKFTSPAPGVNADGFSYRATGQIRPQYSELYLITLNHDDAIKVWIDGQLLLDVPYASASSSFSISMVADQLYDIQIDMVQFNGFVGANNWECRLKWQSTSQSQQVIPATRAYATDIPVYRYAAHMAFPFALEASEVHERLMERCPGWDWTDRDGKVEFLGPDREVVFAFEWDKDDDDSAPNFVKHSFQKKRRAMNDRRNFLLFRFRDVLQTGYPIAFVQADREDLRRFTNGEPTNDPATDLGVSTRSLAERMAEMEMVLKTDPTHSANISGGRAASAIRKNELVTVSYYDSNGAFVADQTYQVIFHAWGATNDRNDFTLLPVTLPFYTDEPYVAP